MTDAEVLLQQVARLPIRGRVAFAAAVGELCTDVLEPDAIALRLARRALDDCWRWLGGEPLEGNVLAEYVDGAPENDLGGRQLECSGQVRDALIAVTTAIAFAAHHAYEAEKCRSRPAAIWEVSENAIEEVTVRAIRANGAIRAMLSTIVHGIEADCAGAGHEDLGPNLSRGYEISS